MAYRYFATPRRRFILADTPGHVQYTRNMVTGASTAELAIVQDLGGAAGLTANDLGRITLRTAEPLAVDDYAVSRRTGAFLVIDPADGATLTAGMVEL